MIAFSELFDLNLVVEVCSYLSFWIFEQNAEILNLNGKAFDLDSLENDDEVQFASEIDFVIRSRQMGNTRSEYSDRYFLI